MAPRMLIQHIQYDRFLIVVNLLCDEIFWWKEWAEELISAASDALIHVVEGLEKQISGDGLFLPYRGFIVAHDLTASVAHMQQRLNTVIPRDFAPLLEMVE